MATTPPSAEGIEIWYTTDGDPGGEPLLMINGLGMQYLGWDEDLVAMFVARGFFVIRPDNRDIGLSTKPDVGDLDVAAALMATLTGEPDAALAPPYLLSDMAADVVAVLDDLGVESAHVLGASMGGMIAQVAAIEHPERVRTLTSVMSCPGVPESDPAVLPFLLAPPPTTREEAVASGVAISVAIGSPGLVDESAAADRAGRAWDRSQHTTGVGHQLLAIVSSPDRTPGLTGLDVPALVIHGDRDPLVTPSGGVATAAAIPGAVLRMVEGMGHDVPPVHWDELVDELTALTTRAVPAAG